MGADIHFVIENRDPRDNHGWVGVYFSDSPLAPPSYNHRYVYDQNANISAEKQLRRMDDGVSPLGRLSRRDYSFFARLAGVRGDGPEPNGVPDDASVMTRRCVERWEGDGHSHGYVSLREFVRLKLLHNDTIAEAAKAKLKGRDPIEDFLSEHYDGNDITLDDNTRVVYWFDN